MINNHLNSQKVLTIVAILLIITFFAELLGGIVFGSLSLISDAFHVIADLGSILIASLALSVAQRRKPTQQMAFEGRDDQHIRRPPNGHVHVSARASRAPN